MAIDLYIPVFLSIKITYYPHADINYFSYNNKEVSLPDIAPHG